MPAKLSTIDSNEEYPVGNFRTTIAGSFCETRDLAFHAIALSTARCDEVMRKLQTHQLAFPVGHCPQVEASGYLLSGGIAWNANEWGKQP